MQGHDVLYTLFLARCNAWLTNARTGAALNLTDPDFLIAKAIHLVLTPRNMAAELAISAFVQQEIRNECTIILICLFVTSLFACTFAYYRYFLRIMEQLHTELLQSINLLWVVNHFARQTMYRDTNQLSTFRRPCQY